MSALNHPHPGTTIRDLVLEPMTLSVNDAAKTFNVSYASLTQVLKGQASITTELAKGLELAGFSTAPFWMTLQLNYDVKHRGFNYSGGGDDNN